ERIVGASRPIREVLADKVRAEEIGPVPASAVTLRDAGEIELGVLQERAFDVEAGLQRVFAIFRDERAKEIRTHTGVQVLTNLESDFSFFGERKGNMFGDLIFGGVQASQCGEIRLL